DLHGLDTGRRRRMGVLESVERQGRISLCRLRQRPDRRAHPGLQPRKRPADRQHRPRRRELPVLIAHCRLSTRAISAATGGGGAVISAARAAARLTAPRPRLRFGKDNPHFSAHLLSPLTSPPDPQGYRRRTYGGIP